MNTPEPHSNSDAHLSPDRTALHRGLRKLDVYKWERLAFTDAASNGAPHPPKPSRRQRWLEAVRCWVLSRM
jgi:hypothetical protein